MFNFTVQRWHTYFGGTGVLVHNVCTVAQRIAGCMSRIPEGLKQNMQCTQFAAELRPRLSRTGIAAEQITLTAPETAVEVVALVRRTPTAPRPQSPKH